MTRVLRVTGWTLIAAGVTVLLYVVYALFFTGVETSSAQAEMLEDWRLRVGVVGERIEDVPAEPADDPAEDVDEPAPDLGGALAVMEFRRPGSDEPLVRDDPVFVVSGVTPDDLTRGPGHYPGTALPGEPGNFAVAGHRTTYGAPFFHLDQLQDGDEVLVTDRDGATHVYRVVEQRIVAPTDASVLAPDPLGISAPTLTLTTCHPRFSARERLIVFAELIEEPGAE